MTAQRSILVMSGGVESLVLAAIYRSENPSGLGHAFFVDYGQRPVEQERRAVTRIARHYGLNLEVATLDLPFLHDHAMADADTFIVDDGPGSTSQTHIVPARNLIFLSLASSYAHEVGAGEIWTGFDFVPGGALDKSPGFVEAFQDVLQSLLMDVKVRTPFQGGTKGPLSPSLAKKVDTIMTGLSHHVDWSLSWSCYNDLALPCGVCGSCKVRREAFEKVLGPDFDGPYASEDVINAHING